MVQWVGKVSKAMTPQLKLTLAAYFSDMSNAVYCSYFSVAAQLIRLATHPQTKFTSQRRQGFEPVLPKLFLQKGSKSAENP